MCVSCVCACFVCVVISDGHVVPSYFLDFSNSKSGVALPSTEAKVVWPPPEGYTIAFWLTLTSDGGGAHSTSLGSGKRLRIVPGKAVSESHVTNIDLREHKSDEAATHIFTLNSANKQCQTEVSSTPTTPALRSSFFVLLPTTMVI